MDALENQNVTLSQLDGIEKAELEKKSRGGKESSFDKEFWQMKAQMHDKFLDDFAQLRKKALHEERKSGGRHDEENSAI